MTTHDFIIELFCRVDDAMPELSKHPLAALHPSEVITLGLLQALRAQGSRAFYRWAQRDLKPLKKLAHRVWKALQARLAYTVAAYNLCITWSGQVKLELAPFAL